ncbi:hypothetical protein Gorai_010056 [Gossypium raimondii]|uniref:Translation elongation factor EF1B beta/delta subunit guanine nucleotide exchange domain-containing protein n=1 Tax=Gossypium raimondii TaxID=29730 RepID=A0A7J8PV19_GOSRA|nr:hypothetical protein [Gossypium raimondii]
MARPEARVSIFEFRSVFIENPRPPNEVAEPQFLCQYPKQEMAVTFNDLGSAAGLKKLDEYLLTRSYISGYQASKDDITVYAALSGAPSSSYVNVSRWYKHIDALLRIS